MRILLFCSCFLIGWIISARADTITYNLNVSVGNLTATGTITTDGYIGVFPNTTLGRLTHIASYSVDISSGVTSDNINSDYHHIGGIQGFALIATSTELLWDFDAPNSLFNMFTGLGRTEFMLGTGSAAMQMYQAVTAVVGIISAEGTQRYSGVQTIASINAPLPATLPLFVTGLGVLLIAGRRKKCSGQ